MPKIKGKKKLSLDIPADLYIAFGKLCMDLELTKTQALIESIQDFLKRYSKQKKARNEQSEPNIELDARKSK